MAKLVGRVGRQPETGFAGRAEVEALPRRALNLDVKAPRFDGAVGQVERKLGHGPNRDAAIVAIEGNGQRVVQLGTLICVRQCLGRKGVPKPSGRGSGRRPY